MAEAVITISEKYFNRLEKNAWVAEYETYVKDNWTGPSTIEYCSIGLGGEAGEVLNEVKKEMRDGSVRRVLIRDELGDTLHYLVKLASKYGYTLADIMKANIEKLELRKAEYTDQCVAVKGK